MSLPEPCPWAGSPHQNHRSRSRRADGQRGQRTPEHVGARLLLPRTPTAVPVPVSGISTPDSHPPLGRSSSWGSGSSPRSSWSSANASATTTNRIGIPWTLLRAPHRHNRNHWPLHPLPEAQSRSPCGESPARLPGLVVTSHLAFSGAGRGIDLPVFWIFVTAFGPPLISCAPIVQPYVVDAVVPTGRKCASNCRHLERWAAKGPTVPSSSALRHFPTVPRFCGCRCSAPERRPLGQGHGRLSRPRGVLLCGFLGPN